MLGVHFRLFDEVHTVVKVLEVYYNIGLIRKSQTNRYLLAEIIEQRHITDIAYFMVQLVQRVSRLLWPGAI